MVNDSEASRTMLTSVHHTVLVAVVQRTTNLPRKLSCNPLT